MVFSQLIEAQNRFRLELLAKAGVVGVGVGYRDVEGTSTSELALVALVEKKKPLEEIADVDLVPREIEGSRTDVIEVGQLRAQLGSRDRWRPTIPCGVSIGHPQVTAGTLGMMVRDARTGEPLILSNNHVLAYSNGARIGDEIVQPGTTDGGRYPADGVGRLARFWRIYWTDEVGAIVPPPPTSYTPPPTTPTTPIGEPAQPTTPTTPPPPDNLPELPVIDPNLPYDFYPPKPTQPTTPVPTTPTTPTTPAPTTPTTPTQPTTPAPTTPTDGTTEAQGCASLIRNFGLNLSRANQKPATTTSRASAQTANMRATGASAQATIRAQTAIPENRVDVALATPTNPAIFRNDVLNIGRITGTGVPYLGQQIRKMGRTSGYTTGRITLINATIDVAYDTPWGTKTARFSGQVLATGMSQGGDSGSLIVDMNSQTALGLLFAGSPVATVFTPIETVMQYGQFYFA